MTDTPALGGLLRRALLACNARALHAGGEAGRHAATFVNEVATGLLPAMGACSDPAERELLAEAHRCLSMAAGNPLGQSCREREDLVNIACHALAHALLARPQGRASKEQVHAFPAEQWTASLPAWSMIFPAALDTVSPPCACGAMGTRPVPAPVER
ncbi:hypothetical protein [Streptomyces telluris]|uniref:Uncharacterized protein n=1 Tax=Streptomyces telluris TaxID=2720021 RepID=A0A9X2LNZ8_9ACTN|nr:hypothetical protein [Streptomyces telluris]MCQ8774814.1 hypothetical protein [Streptomyces telluris]NJP82166.1 hypothetical protein [Streptomyces telluris]